MSSHLRLPGDRRPRIYIIHENAEWVAPLHAALREQGLPFADLFIDGGALDLTQAPPPGVYYNRMSASSHTRGHRYAAELTGALLAHLEAHHCSVANGGRALQLEISKVAQYAALARFDIPVPRTIAAAGDAALLEHAKQFAGPFILKHNRGGKGLGVQLFRSVEALHAVLQSGTYETPIDGLTLLQDYIEAPAPFITRMEFVGGKFLYAVRVDTSAGFELCPADACAPTAAICAPGEAPADKFHIVDGFHHDLIERCEAFLAANDIAIAGIEFIVDRAANAFVYDVNTNTNYNPQAEAKAGRSGMGAIAAFLGERLRAQREPAQRYIATHPQPSSERV